MSTLSTANITSKAANTPPVTKDLNGTECGRFCRAYVTFNNSYTVLESFNVSAVTEVNTNIATVNLNNAMTSTNYLVVGHIDNNVNQEWVQTSTKTTSSFEYRVYTGSSYTKTGGSFGVIQ